MLLLRSTCQSYLIIYVVGIFKFSILVMSPQQLDGALDLNSVVPLNLAWYVVTGCWSQWKAWIAVLKSYRDTGLLIGMRLRGWGVLATDWVTLANKKFYFWFIQLNQAVKRLQLWVIFDHECNVGPISICLYVTSISNRQTDRKL